MNAPELFELQMTRLIRAPRERVCDAFLSAEHLRAWMGTRSMRVVEASADARVGGHWRVAMVARDGSRFAVGGEYREIRPPERVAFTWAWEAGPMPGMQTLVEVTFTTQADEMTLLQMRHSGFPAAAARDAHGQGWNGSLNRLVEHLDPRGSLLPGTIAERARCEQWISVTNACLYDTMVRRYVLQFLYPRGEGGQPDRGVIGGALKQMPAQLAALEQGCARSDFLAGPAISMADLFVAPILAYVERMPDGKALLADAPRLMRSQARVRERTSFTATEPGFGQAWPGAASASSIQGKPASCAGTWAV